MGRKAAVLVPGGHIIGHGRNDFRRVFFAQNFARHETKTDPPSITHKTNFGRQPWANRGQSFVIACHCQAVQFGKQRIFQLLISPAPFGNLQTGTQLGISLIDRVSEQPGRKRTAAGDTSITFRAERNNRPSVRLINAADGLGRLLAAMWPRRSGVVAMAVLPDFSSTGGGVNCSSRWA